MHTLGVVSYRNALPLWKPLETLSPATRIVRDLPARLQHLLDARQVEAALLPAVDFFRHGGHLISNACIAAEGDVRSVLIFSRKPPRDWRTIALDTSSHTSVALTQVLLRDHWKITPTLHDHAPNFKAMSAHDAWLLIGDPALEARQKYLEHSQIHIFDLAFEWRALTGSPFVFAAWIARADLNSCERQELGDLLSLARDHGLRQISELARESATEVLGADVIESYLRHAIQFSLSDRHREAMEEFRRRCEVDGLI